MTERIKRAAQSWLDRFGAGHEEYLFRCPGGCGDHRVVVRGGANYKGPVWSWNGSKESPTFSPSLLVTWGYTQEEHGFEERYVCHSHIRGGQVQFLDDCTHAMAGLTVGLPPISS